MALHREYHTCCLTIPVKKIHSDSDTFLRSLSVLWASYLIDIRTGHSGWISSEFLAGMLVVDVFILAIKSGSASATQESRRWHNAWI